jgi:hypothetical protein
LAPITAEASGGDLDKAINNVRRVTIYERKNEVRIRRDHRVGTANYRKGDGGLTVGATVKDKNGVYKIESAGNWKSGYAPDSDASQTDLLHGNGLGQINSKPDQDFGEGFDSVLNMNAGPKPAKGSLVLKIEAARNLPKPIDERIGRKEKADFSKSLLHASTKTGIGIATPAPISK